MAESEETKAAVEYWDRVAASAKRGTKAETVEHNPGRGEEGDERNHAARRGRRR
jgi:hypothetical protein